MKLLKLDVLRDLKEDLSMAQTIDKASHRFKAKNAFESLSAFAPLAIAGRYFLPVLSIITGVFSLLYVLDSFMNIWLSSLLCFALLALWEKTKSLALVKAFERFYKGFSSSAIGVFVFAILFSLGSMYLSVNGAWELSKRFDDTEQKIEMAYGHQLDSLESYYIAKITDAKTEAKSYFEKNSYQGVITFSKDGRYADHYKKLQERVLELETKKEIASERLLHEKAQSLKLDKTAYQRLVYSLLTITFLIELLIILSNWFPVYFDYKIYEENYLMNHAKTGNKNVSAAQIFEVIQTYVMPRLNHLNSQQLTASATATDNRIGFQQSVAKPATNADSLANGKRNSATDYNDLVTELKAGARDYRYLMKKYKINVNTLNAYIEKYC